MWFFSLHGLWHASSTFLAPTFDQIQKLRVESELEDWIVIADPRSADHLHAEVNTESDVQEGSTTVGQWHVVTNENTLELIRLDDMSHLELELPWQLWYLSLEKLPSVELQVSTHRMSLVIKVDEVANSGA